jgi:hypothetical protein
LSKNVDNRPVVIPCVKISGQGITFYNQYEGVTRAEKKEPHIKSAFCTFSDKKPTSACNFFKPADESNFKYVGTYKCEECVYKSIPTDKEEKPDTPETLSRKSISGIKNSIYALLWLADCKTFLDDYIVTSTYRKISFMTLTLCSPQHHPDTFIKSEMLNQFFTELRNFFPDLMYVWRSEKQKNGNVHFHVLMNKYYKADHLTRQWNRILDKHDYVKHYTEKFSHLRFDEYRQYIEQHYTRSYEEIQKSYKNGCINKWKNPPSTQIQSLQSVGNISGYISKEMTKENQISQDGMSLNKWEFPVSGKNWSCSELLSAKSYFSDQIPNDINQELQQLQHKCNDKMFQNDYITHFSISPDEFLRLKLPRLHAFYQNFLKAPVYKKSKIITPEEIIQAPTKPKAIQQKLFF